VRKEKEVASKPDMAAQHALATWALENGYATRMGLEDKLRLASGEPASGNEELVRNCRLLTEGHG